MLQQVMTNPGEITFREVPVPEVKDEQVLVKIRNIGICGSDIHVYHGKHPFTKYPVTQGHEVSGEIAEIGKKCFRVSDRTESYELNHRFIVDTAIRVAMENIIFARN
mgnify:CR=1 FL=1